MSNDNPKDRPDLVEQTDNGPREEDGDQPDDHLQEPTSERDDLV